MNEDDYDHFWDGLAALRDNPAPLVVPIAPRFRQARDALASAKVAARARGIEIEAEPDRFGTSIIVKRKP